MTKIAIATTTYPRWLMSQTKKNRTPASRSSDFVYHSNDCRPNRTPLGPITIINYNVYDFIYRLPRIVKSMILTLSYYIKAPVLPHYSKYRESRAETHDGGLSDYFTTTPPTNRKSRLSWADILPLSRTLCHLMIYSLTVFLESRRQP